MANAQKDENGVSTLIAVSNADGKSVIRVCSDPTLHSLCTMDGVSGSDLSNDSNALRDENSVPVFLAVSYVDGVTPVEIYADSVTNKLLIKTT